MWFSVCIVTNVPRIGPGSGGRTLVPGREVSRIRLQDILDMVRTRGKSGFDRDPSWGREVSVLGRQLNEAVNAVVAEESLADFLDRIAISG